MTKKMPGGGLNDKGQSQQIGNNEQASGDIIQKRFKGEEQGEYLNKNA